jgi:hypothetical protein
MRLSLSLLALLVLAAPAHAADVHLRGTAYEFNRAQQKLAGAQIRVAEDPALGTTTRRDGTYALRVPAGRKVTPYIVARGYHTVYLQTFTPRVDHDRVNFQTPTDAVYGALAALLNVPLGADGNPAQCAIVSTFSTRDVRDLTFAGFVAYGAHGVAGATASASPALPKPIYFNEQVIPDTKQVRSSEDGGVIWTGVPTGVYTIRAAHPSTRFASFTATCAPGRIVNANPTWGLYELGRRNPATIRARWDGTTPRSIRVAGLPAKARVELTCTGPRCPFTTRTVRRTRGGTVDVARLARGLRRGQTLGVLAAASGHDGTLVRYRVGTGGSQRRCVPLGTHEVKARC